jgi:hypothetical protein
MRELVLLVPAQSVDSVSDALMFELGALSVSVEDADAGQESERALFGEPGMPAPASGWKRSRVVALYDSEAAAREAVDALMASSTDGHALATEQGLAFLGIQTVPDRLPSRRTFGWCPLGTKRQRMPRTFCVWILGSRLAVAPIPPRACAWVGWPQPMRKA